MLNDFFKPVNYNNTKTDRLGSQIQYEIAEPELLIIGLGKDAELYLNETRKKIGNLFSASRPNVTDAGNLIPGHAFSDTMVALDEILAYYKNRKTRILFIIEEELYGNLLLGKIQLHGTGELTFAGNLTDGSSELMEMTISNNHKDHRYFNILAYQNYLNDPSLIDLNNNIGGETLRLGPVRDYIASVEPSLRRSSAFAFHMNAMKSNECGDVLINNPNGLSAQEACKLFHYAGLSSNVKYTLLYPFTETGLSTMFTAQVLWHFIEGNAAAKYEIPQSNSDDFLKFYVEMEKESELFIFYQSKFTGRWWLQIDHPHKETENTAPVILPCTENDYRRTLNGELPDAWWLAGKRHL